MQQSSTKMVSTRSGVAPGSVWETRMKIDQVKGGVKVFNADDDGAGGGGTPTRRMVRIQTPNAGTTAEKRKRRNWTTTPEPEKGPPSVLRKTQSEPPSPAPGENSTELGERKPAVVRSLSESVLQAAAEPAAGSEDGCAAEDEEMKAEAEEEEFDDKEMDLHAEEEEEPVEQEDKNVDQIYDVACSASEEEKHEGDAPDPEETGDSALVIANAKFTAPIPVAVERVSVLEPEDEHVEGAAYSQTIPLHHNRMQSLVDLVMWRDISRTAFVFGAGTFLVISGSYAKDVNFSVTSAISYLGLVYLAVIFLFNCILHRGGVVLDDEEITRRWLVGEEEAVWLIRMLLPYVNEILFKLRALFSGDPATTMKLAVFLFALARCGGSITVGTMTKLAFFGAFTVPKLFSAYSHHIARYGTFWVERFRDAWESCTHKKAVAAGVFTLVWNLSSVVARVWALFMLVVALRYYQLQRADTEWTYEPAEVSVDEEEEDKHSTPQNPQKKQRDQAEEGNEEQQPLRQWRRGGRGSSGTPQGPQAAEGSKAGKATPQPVRQWRRPLEPVAVSKERKKAF